MVVEDEEELELEVLLEDVEVDVDVDDVVGDPEPGLIPVRIMRNIVDDPASIVRPKDPGGVFAAFESKIAIRATALRLVVLAPAVGPSEFSA